MGRTKARIILVVFSACFFIAALLFAWLPANSFADTANEATAAQEPLNERLVVKYAMDDATTASGEQLAAFRWNSASQAFLPNAEAAATVQSSASGFSAGSVTSVNGKEGKGALSFTKKAHAQANFSLPSDATGMTVSMWVKNVNTYWSSLVEFWDGTHGGRFGKGTMQGNGGRQNEADPWTSNCPAHNSATIAAGGGWDSFVVEHRNTNNDNGGAAVDPMAPQTWYQITFVLASTEMRAYRDGVLKQTFNKGNSSDIVGSIMTAAKSGKGKLGIRLCHDANDGDVLDDFRIYSGALSGEDVQSLYGEYKGLAAIQGKTVKLDGLDKEYTVDNGSSVRVESTAEAFPIIMIGGVAAADVSFNEETKTYSASASGFSYTYTVGEYADGERTATVTYTDTATGNTHAFTVTQVNKNVVKLTSLKIKVNGVLREIEGFDPDITEYKINLTPDDYSLEFVAETAEGGSCNVDSVNAGIVYNGDNSIKTSGDGESVTYKITVSRERADTALPILNGVQLGLATQNFYVDELPSAVGEDGVLLAYPEGSAVEEFTYDTATHAATFRVADRALGTQTEYRVAYKTKQDGRVAQWSFEESKETGDKANTVFSGMRWDGAQGAYVADASLDMTVRGGAENQAVTDKRAPVAAKQVTGVMGNGIELPAWGYTTAELPAIEGGTTGFTFSTWMKTSGIVWEAVFAVLGDEYGTILEKGHMQRHLVTNGQPVNGYQHLSDSTGDWTQSLSNEKRAEYFNTSAGGAAYVFYTVTVTYANGAGVIKFYKDGELATVYENDEGGTEKAKIIIEAINAGASVGLHRHHYDGGSASRFDETNIYAYAMTDAEVKAAYDAIAELLTASPEYYEVTGLGYPAELLLGGAKSVTDGENGVKTGVTDNGVSYSYTPVTVDATPENDEKGVEVTFEKDGKRRVANVKFRRTLGLAAESLGYKIGNGAAVSIDVPKDANKEIIVKVAADADLSNVKAGNIAAKAFAEDGNAEHYKTQFTYNAKTHTATVRIGYTLYEGQDTLYTIVFVNKSTETFERVSITGGKTSLQLTVADFTENTARIEVEDTGSFTLSVRFLLAAGAQLEGGGEGITFTKEDLSGGKLSVTVVNENGDKVVYSLVPYAPSSVATLSALTAGSHELGFSADKTEYTVLADKGEGERIFNAIAATPSDESAQVKKIYDRTSGSIIVTVTAADGATVQKYVIRVVERDTDATLSRIEVGGAPLAEFDPQKSEYTVKYTGELPTVTAFASSSSAAAPGVSAADADGRVKITVTAENGATKTYTVTLVKKSADAALKKLTLNGTEVSFSGNTAEYTAPYGTKLRAISVHAEVAEVAEVSHEIDANENKIIFTVTAEDGTKATYTVSVKIASGILAEGGVREDNSPKPSGVSPAVIGVCIAAGAVVLLAGAAGAWLILRKKKRVATNSEDRGNDSDE